MSRHAYQLQQVAGVFNGLWLRTDRNPDREVLWLARDGYYRATPIVRFRF